MMSKHSLRIYFFEKMWFKQGPNVTNFGQEKRVECVYIIIISLELYVSCILKHLNINTNRINRHKK